MNEILVNVRPNETRVAYVENGELCEFKTEKRKVPTHVGSIYKGRVERVLPGMQAAFVNIGLERTAFLYVTDVYVENKGYSYQYRDDEDESFEEENNTVDFNEEKIPIQDLLTEGQYILVQVAKDPIGTKGARITTHISLPGRNLVYMPEISHHGVSRKISQNDERERLLEIASDLAQDGGVIIRTAGEGGVREEFQSDLDYLKRIWESVNRQYSQQKALGLIYSDVDVELRALRDLLSDKVEKVIVDDQVAFDKIKSFLHQFLSQFESKLELYSSPQPLFDKYDLDLELSRSLDRKVWLKSGGYIVIDEAEALVVIDVNTGKFVGKKDLGETILKTNLEAVKEIAYQIKIRNCGGIIIIDLIDMEKPLHRERVMQALEDELGQDKARTEVHGLSSLGLVEMTRKRIRPSLVSTLCRPCPYCDGSGFVKRASSVANEIFRDLEREYGRLTEKKEAYVHCHRRIADWIYEEEAETLEFVEKKLSKTVNFIITPNFHEEEYEIFC